MIVLSVPLYLASKSPRRRKLLKQLNLKFNSFHVELKEEILDGEHPIRTVKRLSLEKMSLAKSRVKRGIIITADTIVVLDKKIIGKPTDKEDAVRILNKLSNNKHFVYTGLALFNTVNGKTLVDYVKTGVTFNKLDDKLIKDYVESGSPMDKAGAYGIQDDFGSVFVKKIEGCYYNVVGLPLSRLYEMIQKVV
ncbi:MAG: septum formation protein Maf [Melioribacteraceae bacterium]|nr:septum formation protein Maf [Melioribacteraceae bacterium]